MPSSALHPARPRQDAGHKRGREVEDYGSWRCTGYGGNCVYVSAGDQRTYVSFGPKRRERSGGPADAAAFNSEGKTIEWRIEQLPNGKTRPFATILRWNTTVMEDNDDAGARPGAGGDAARSRRRLPCRLCRWPRQSDANDLAVHSPTRAPQIPMRQGQAGDRRRKRPGLQRAVQRLAAETEVASSRGSVSAGEHTNVWFFCRNATSNSTLPCSKRLGASHSSNSSRSRSTKAIRVCCRVPVTSLMTSLGL